MQEYSLTPAYNTDIELLELKVKALVITSESDNIAASRLLGEIDNKLEEVTGHRDGIIDEYEKRIEDTKLEFQPYVRALASFRDTVKAEMLSYKERAKIMIRDIRNDIATGKIERSEVFLDDKGKIINESALSIRTGEGLSSVRKYFTIEVTDFSMIPDTYKKFDKAKVLSDAKKGILNIPGVKITPKTAIMYRGKSTKAA